MTAADHRLEKHSVAIAGHRTSVTLEAIFWRALKSIARARGRPLSELVAEIDRKRGEMDPPPNLSSALRVFVLGAMFRSADRGP
jgi:predicted DNA-binding ribbon-helix-helix protein